MTAINRHVLICCGISFAVFTAILLWGTLGSITGDEMGYAVLSFYLIMPVVSFVTAIILGLKSGRIKWLYPVVFGAYGFIIPYAVFGHTEVFALFFSFVPALLGLGIGLLVRRIRGGQ